MHVPAGSIVIVGGGLSGLTAAARVARLGLPTVLFDDASELGGRARTDRRDGFRLNYGPHRLYESGAAVTGLRSLGVQLDVARRGPNGGFAVWGGRKYTLPVGACSLLTTGLLSPGAKRQVARFLTSLPTLRTDDIHNVSTAEWLRTHVDDDHVLAVVRALIRYATYCDDPDGQSAGAAIDQLQLSIKGGVLHVHNGWESLVSSLQRTAGENGAVILSGRRVVSVNGAHGVAETVTLADGGVVPAAAVIVATAPRTAQRLLSGLAAVDAPKSPVRIAALDVALRKLPNERSVFAIAVDEPWCFSADSAFVRLAPDNGAVVHLAKYLRGNAVGTDSDERQLESALDLIQPGWRSLVVHRRFLSTVVVTHAVVAAESGGFAGRTSGRVSGTTNVFLAGDWIGPIGQLADASVASGLAAAQRAAQLLSLESGHHGAH